MYIDLHKHLAILLKAKSLLFLIALKMVACQVFAGDVKTIIVNGVERKYIIYKPASLKKEKLHAVVLDFHGGGGTASNAEKSFGFNDVADAKKIIVIYPSGINRGWADGRKDGKQSHTADDIAFVSMLIDKLVKDDNADPAKIYATGISNGGFFSIYLACRLGDKIKAVAAVCANLSEDFIDSFFLPKPISFLLINGTADPLVKYEGGAIVSEKANRGRSASTDVTISKWLQANKIYGQPVVENIADLDAKDECTATKYTYSSALNSITVTLIKIQNGGHTWPGGKQYLPRFIIGKICRDFKASDVIWDFFENH